MRHRIRVGKAKKCEQCGKKAFDQKAAMILGKKIVLFGTLSSAIVLMVFGILKLTMPKNTFDFEPYFFISFGSYFVGLILMIFAETIPGEHIFRCIGCGHETKETVPGFGFLGWVFGIGIAIFILLLLALIYAAALDK